MSIFENILLKKSRKPATPKVLAQAPCVVDFSIHVDDIINEWNAFIQEKKIYPIDDVSKEQLHLNADKRWKAFFVYGYGFYHPLNKTYFPLTSSLVKKWKKDITMVMFSTLEPGKHIPPHKGRNYGVYRTQIGISIKHPEHTMLRVNNEVIQLREKETFTFDDTFEHEAWNNGDTPRTVLIIDTKKKFNLFYDIINYFIQRKIGKSDYIQQTINNIKNQNN
jgi:beta-hydroxylase